MWSHYKICETECVISWKVKKGKRIFQFNGIQFNIICLSTLEWITKTFRSKCKKSKRCWVNIRSTILIFIFFQFTVLLWDRSVTCAALRSTRSSWGSMLKDGPLRGWRRIHLIQYPFWNIGNNLFYLLQYQPQQFYKDYKDYNSIIFWIKSSSKYSLMIKYSPSKFVNSNLFNEPGFEIRVYSLYFVDNFLFPCVPVVLWLLPFK